MLPLDFVCKILDVKKEDFATLALANLLEEELDWVQHNNHEVATEEIKRYRETVKAAKVEADSWVTNGK
jgi:hypothetical protein